MKKILVFLLALTLVVPSLAFAKAEFSLGGFIKLDTFWDSTQATKNMLGSVARDNNILFAGGRQSFHHGHLKFTAQGSRFNFTIKGPKLFGALVTGFIEIDFDPTERVRLDGADTASNSFTPRLRHAMFRFNWPATELIMGQYWSMFCEWYAETAEDGPFQREGTPTARLAQIRLTQTFMNDWTVAALIGEPFNMSGTFAEPYTGTATNGESAETPQIQGKVRYAHDWWGKAAYYGKPIPFTAQVVAGWQRNIVRPTAAAVAPVFQQDPAGVGAVAGFTGNQYQPAWLLMGSLFIPVLPTHSANLAGTASILAQWWIGQSVNSFGFTGDTSLLWKFNNNFAPGLVDLYDVRPIKRWGGFIEGQYYFTNQWYLNVAYAMSRVYGIDQDQNFAALGGREVGFTADQSNMEQQIDATLWYRPIQAVKFGLQYSYSRTVWMQKLSDTVVGNNVSDQGNEHRVEFVGYFFF